MTPNLSLPTSFIGRSDTDVLAAFAKIDKAFGELGGTSASPATLLPKWIKARDAARVGDQNARVAFVGDSKTRGQGAGTAISNGALMAGAYSKSRPWRVGELLRASGINTIMSSLFGYGGVPTPTDLMAYDTRLTGAGAWLGGSSPSLGGTFFAISSDALASFYPDEPVDRVSLFYRDSAGRPNITVGRGVDPAQTIIPLRQAIPSVQRVDLTFATLDRTPITFGRAAGATNTASIVGLIAWNSKTPGVEICNFGVAGVNSAYQANYDATNDRALPRGALMSYAPHLTIINLGTNDLNQSVTVSAYIASMQAIISAAQISGDVVLCWPAVAGAEPSGGLDAARSSYKAKLKELAAANGCLFQDEEMLFNGRAGAVAQNWFSDAIHESAAAYYREAGPIARLMLMD